MKKELTTTTTSLEMLQTLRNTVAPGLTEPEFMLFVEMCRATGLNPATKEIWAIKAGGRLQLMTGINGFLRIANSHPEFDGMEVAFEWDGKTLVSCTVKVHRKDRKYPSVATAYMTEYAKQTPIWRTMPTVMLSKCAKSLAIREAMLL
jgi:phage recombination protein Bet